MNTKPLKEMVSSVISAQTAGAQMAEDLPRAVKFANAVGPELSTIFGVCIGSAVRVGADDETIIGAVAELVRMSRLALEKV